MDLSRNIIKKYVEVATPVEVTENDKTVYGKIVGEGDELYVKLDGSDALTPISSAIDVRDGDRVLVLIKNHEAMVLGSPTSPTARLEELRALEGDVTEFGVILADKVGVGELVAMQALIEELQAEDVEISGKLTANDAKIESLEAENVTINGKLDVYQADIEELEAKKIDATAVEVKYATIGSLEVTDAKVTNLEASYGEFSSATIERLNAHDAAIDNLDVTYATVGQLDAEKARITDLEATRLTADSAEIKNLQADVADIDTLIFGSASGTTIQTSFANAVIAQLGNAQIKSAMIESLSASKISTGDILTNNIRVLSEDGKLLISDETIQISDDTRVRVQIGKDASNDYSVNVWDAAGKLMFSAGGITDAAIKDAIIRDDMVSDTANIKASKLDISSLFSEINNSTETINSNKVLIDTDAGTLDVAFTKMSSDIDDISEEVATQGTALSVVQGQISSKVWLDDIKETDLGEVEGAISTLETQYSELNQTVSGISATVGQHTTQIANKADSSTVTAVSDRVTEVEADLEGFRTNVSETYATKTALSATDTKAANAATAASNAQSTANEAKTNAATAQSTANTAKTNAATAQSAAEAAQSTANTAKTNAAAAQTSANNAATAASNAQKAADDAAEAASNAQDDVDALETRVTMAETSISQNAEAIELRATKSELTTVSNAASAAQSTANTAKTNAATAQSTADGVKTNLANNYYTKSQTDAQIKVSSDAITSTVTALETTLSEDYSTTSEMNSAITQKAGEITQSVSATYATKTELNNKADDYTILLYNGTGGNPKPVKFATVNYSTCNSENGVCVKISMVSGHGNGTSYAFLQDATIRVNYNGGVEVDNVKHYGANAGTYDGAVRQYGDIFWVINTTNKVVDFYCLMGQYARVYQTPWKRLTYSSGGTVTQYTSCTVYSSGTKVWANNSDIALMTDVINLDTKITQNAEAIALRATKTELTTVSNTANAAQETADDAAEAAANAQTTANTANSTANTAKTNAATAQTTANNAATAAANAQSSADDAQDAAEAAQSTANSVQTNLADNYYTKTQTDAQIEVSADSITSTVSSIVQGDISNVDDRVTEAYSEIEQLAMSISNLVVDENGQTLMTQTADGWVFSTGNINSALSTITNALDSLVSAVGEWDIDGTVVSNINSLLSVVGDHGDALNWVTIGEIDIDGDGSTEPCIELGENDSIYKLVITNKAIYFREGSATPTKIQDNTLVTNNVEVENELRQTNPSVSGHWIWMVRQNGNYGLTWKEG